MRFKITRHLLALSALTLVGCVSIDLPDDFLVTQNDPSDFRAVTSDEAKVWIRNFNEGKGGTLAFWEDALKRNFEESRGYTFVNKTNFKDGRGTQASLMRFTTRAAGASQFYSIVLSITKTLFGTTVRVSEFVAEKEAYEKYHAAVEKAFAFGAALPAPKIENTTDRTQAPASAPSL